LVIAGVVWNHVFALVELLNFHFLNTFHLCTNCVFALLEFLYNCNFSINYIFAHLVSLYKLNYCTIFIFWHKFSLCTTCSVFALYVVFLQLLEKSKFEKKTYSQILLLTPNSFMYCVQELSPCHNLRFSNLYNLCSGNLWFLKL